VKALVEGALPAAEVKRKRAKRDRIPPGGLVVIRDGDPGEPEVLLSPLTYVYSHRIAIEVAAYESSSFSREQVLDQMLGAIGDAVQADRTLGGLCDFVEVEAPSADDAETLGAVPVRFAEIAVVAVYGVSNPLN
jgi:hypothetical protein